MNDREERRMLVVDESETRCLLQDIYFSEFGFKVECAIDGETALRKVRDLSPDVVLLSMSLCGVLDSHTVLRHMKIGWNARVIALTNGSTDTIDSTILVDSIDSIDSFDRTSNVLALGAEMLVVRPCLPDVLLRHVTRLLGADSSPTPATSERVLRWSIDSSAIAAPSRRVA